jgi:hypothetical protein
MRIAERVVRVPVGRSKVEAWVLLYREAMSRVISICSVEYWDCCRIAAAHRLQFKMGIQ